MEHKEPAPTKNLQLPTIIVGAVEIRRLQRELEEADELMRQADLRKKDTKTTASKVPTASHFLQAIIEANHFALEKPADRDKLTAFLQQLLDKAPVIHIGFAVDPSAVFTEKIVAWLRQNIHPYVLVQVGLQPNIAAGCVVRTANKQFDLSLRQRFRDSRPLLLQALQEAKT